MNKIICPVDFSVLSRVALQVSAQLAVDFKVELIAIHVAHIPVSPIGEESYFPAAIENMKVEEDLLKQWIKQLPIEQTLLNYKVIAKSGFLLEELSELGDRSTLIVSGSAGMDDLVTRLMGTITSDLFFKGVSPVLLIPKGFEVKRFSNICFATDLMSPPQWDVHEIIAMAQCWGAHLAFLSVMDDAKIIDIERVEESFVHQYLKDTKYSNASFHLNQASNPVQGIKHFMQMNKTDLLVLTHRDRTFWQGLFEKSVSGEFIAHPEVPLLLFHHVVEN